MNQLGKIKLLILLVIIGITSFFIISSYAQSSSYTPSNTVCEDGLEGPIPLDDVPEEFDRGAYVNRGVIQDCLLCNNDGVCNNANADVDYGEDLNGCGDCIGTPNIECVTSSECPVCPSGEDRICRNPGTTSSRCDCDVFVASGTVGECELGLSKGPEFVPDTPNVKEDLLPGKVKKDSCESQYDTFASSYKPCGTSFAGGTVQARHLIWNGEVVRFDVCKLDNFCKKSDVRAQVVDCRNINTPSGSVGTTGSACGPGEFATQAFFDIDSDEVTGIILNCCKVEVTC